MGKSHTLVLNGDFNCNLSRFAYFTLLEGKLMTIRLERAVSYPTSNNAIVKLPG